MMQKIILRTPLKSSLHTATHCHNFQSNTNFPVIRRYPPLSSNSAKRFLSDKIEIPNSLSELNRVDSLINGRDYKHWLVIMDPPEGYPSRDQLIQYYARTLAGAPGRHTFGCLLSEEAAKRSMYPVSTKYYYAFSCKLPENMTHKIKSLPKVRRILANCYMPLDENDYGGEPFINGEIILYHDEYHNDWLPSENTNTCSKITRSRKARKGKRKG